MSASSSRTGRTGKSSSKGSRNGNAKANRAARTQGRNAGRGKARGAAGTRNGAGPIAFFVSLFIIALGLVQLFSAFHTYALNLAELNGLKREEAALIEQKQELENNIERWNDTAYVTAQARERLGFVFPGEQAVRVEHPEAVTGDADDADTASSSSSVEKKVLPWYSELAYSFKEADQADASDVTSTQSDGSEQGDAASTDGTADGDGTGEQADAGQAENENGETGENNTDGNTGEGQ